MGSEMPQVRDLVSSPNPEVTIMIMLSVLLTSISFVIVSCRSVIRYILIRNSGLDDYMIIGALITTIGYVATLFNAKQLGTGMPMTTLSIDQMTSLLKNTLAIELIYYTVIAFIKFSIIFTYERFAVTKVFKKFCFATNIFLAVFYVVCVGVTLGQCRPLDRAWDIQRVRPGDCINLTAFFYFTSAVNIFTDLWILILPIPTLRKLQISPNNRYMLFGIFGVGAVATAFSCVRLYSIHTYTQASDPFRDGVLINLWSMVEINIAIACACAPALKPLFTPRRLVEEMRKRHDYTYDNKRTGVTISSGNTRSSRSQTGFMRVDSPRQAASPVRSASSMKEDLELQSVQQAHGT